MIELPLTLIPLVALALVALLHELNHHLGIGVCGCHQSLPCLWRRRWRVRLIPITVFQILTRWRSHPEEGDIC